MSLCLWLFVHRLRLFYALFGISATSPSARARQFPQRTMKRLKWLSQCSKKGDRFTRIAPDALLCPLHLDKGVMVLANQLVTSLIRNPNGTYTERIRNDSRRLVGSEWDTQRGDPG